MSIFIYKIRNNKTKLEEVKLKEQSKIHLYIQINIHIIRKDRIIFWVFKILLNGFILGHVLIAYFLTMSPAIHLSV